MSESLSQKVAVVVGASSGMGRATVLALADAGAQVIAAARRRDRLEEAAREFESRKRQRSEQGGGAIETVPLDVTVANDVGRLISATAQRHGRIDLLVYATGTNIPHRALEVLTPETWQSMLATNLTGAFLCTKAVLPVMRAGGGGLIVYLSTGAVQMPDVSGVAYQASKHGLSGLAHGTRIEERANGIRTTVIFPGLCDTEILSKRPVPTPRDVLDKALRPEDVAEAVLFVARLHPRAVVPELQLFPSRL
ncbi:MAG: SDR family oxidoreductase [Planctomycetes bacterium]|nr:SDR family oxidoreductase [Planctomycetota bacterium]